MKNCSRLKNPILVAGDAKLTYSLTACLLKGGNEVMMYTPNDRAVAIVNTYLQYQHSITSPMATSENFCTIDNLIKPLNCKIAIAVTHECVTVKRDMLKKIESVVADDTIIAINTESIALSKLHVVANNPERMIGANWVEPVHTTSFLEIITNDYINEAAVQEFYQLAKLFWEKDPYIVKSDCGIRSKVIAALIREACFLVENGYATVQDIDRACRNDAGYYLPFAGNFRYMDLMGTNAYGMVMKDLNPNLCKDKEVPKLVSNIIDGGGEGMANNKGFYTYGEDEVKDWEEKLQTFSHEIKEIIDKYPFNYLEEAAPVDKNSYH
ncbi:MAG: 3-hydroxyacyl-CoA dehydrogenase NAD-binding domain-containing protein [Chitinophagaceae bacterium]